MPVTAIKNVLAERECTNLNETGANYPGWKAEPPKGCKVGIAPGGQFCGR